MARCFSAKKSSAGKKIKCGRCGHKIEPGKVYFYFSVGFRGVKQIRCGAHKPRTSELTGSKLSGAYAAMEAVEDVLSGVERSEVSIEEIAEALDTCATEIEGVRDEYQESYDNMGDNFQNSSPGEEVQEKIDALYEFAQTLNSAAEDVRNVSDDVSAEEMNDEACEIAENALGEFSL